jgi:dihydroorotate dehydrogenase (NAD+) catalytic subunit
VTDRIVLGVPFQNPVLLAAGTAGFGLELEGVMDLDALGGIVTKAVSLEPRIGNRPPRVTEFFGGMMNSVGLANPGLDEARTRLLPALVARLRRARVLVNVVGFREEEYAEVISGLEDVEGLVGYELNLSCPNTSKGGVEFGADAEAVARVVSLARRAARRPLVVKLSPALPDIAGMAVVARDAGALYRGGRPRLGNGNGGVSGPALLPVGVLATRRVVERTGGMPVIGVGGVRTADDARQYLDAGAVLVAIGTAGLADPRLPQRVVRGLEQGRGTWRN